METDQKDLKEIWRMIKEMNTNGPNPLHILIKSDGTTSPSIYEAHCIQLSGATGTGHSADEAAARLLRNLVHYLLACKEMSAEPISYSPDDYQAEFDCGVASRLSGEFEHLLEADIIFRVPRRKFTA